MTALSKYQRLECPGLWRPPAPNADPDSPRRPEKRREVNISFGTATLVLGDANGSALTHWSLAAVERLNPGERPALFSPDSQSDTGAIDAGAIDAGQINDRARARETLEIDDPDMIDAIETVRTALRKRQPRAGRLRMMVTAGVLALTAGLAVFWLPGALIQRALSVVPRATRAQIGQTLLTNISRVAGRPCAGPFGARALGTLARELSPADPLQLVVLPAGVTGARQLPGSIMLLDRALVEDYEGPDVLAGFILAEQVRTAALDPLEPVLRSGGILATLRLLTTGKLSDATLKTYGEILLTTPLAKVPDSALLARFEAARIPSSPYAYAIDITGETTISLIEADPYAAAPPPAILSDGNWVSLQGICGQ